MKSNKFNIILLLLCLFSFTGCKKASVKNPSYLGHWISHTGVYDFFIDISDGSEGYYHVEGGKGAGGSASGVARIDLSNKHLYIGITKFRVLQSPIHYTPPLDSIYIRGIYHKLTGLKMTLENSILNGNITLDFLQYKN